MLPAVFSVRSLLLLLLSFFKRHFCSLFQYLSVLFQFQLNSLFFFLFYTSWLWWDLFDFLVLVSCERFLIFCMAWSFFSPFFCAIYIFAFFPALIALMVLSTVLPPCSLMLFSMANWAPQSTVFISRSTHPASTSFLSPSVLLASGVNCTVKNFAKLRVWKWKWNQYMRNDYGVRNLVNKSFYLHFNGSEINPCSPFLRGIDG